MRKEGDMGSREGREVKPLAPHVSIQEATVGKALRGERGALAQVSWPVGAKPMPNTWEVLDDHSESNV